MTGTPGMERSSREVVLVAAARQGDLVAWEQVVRRYQEAAFRTAYLIVRDSEIAASATQSAFVRAYRALPQLHPEHALLPWLFRIVAGEAHQLQRDASRPRASSRPIEVPPGPHYPASLVPGMAQAVDLTPAERTTILEAFDRLGEEDRLTLASRYLFHQSRTDAAASLAIAVGALDEQLARALRHLRARMVES